MDVANAAVTLVVVLGSLVLYLGYVIKMVQTRLPDDEEKARMDAEYLGKS